MRGSSFAITWPFFTREPKSACSSAMRPDTWLPTCTVTRADTVPVAVTRATRSPRSTRALSRWNARDFLLVKCAAAEGHEAAAQPQRRHQPHRDPDAASSWISRSPKPRPKT